MVWGGVKDRGHARSLVDGGSASRGTSVDRRESSTPPHVGIGACAVPALATLLASASASVHLHAACRLHFSASSEDLLHWLSEECSSRGGIRLGELLDDLLIDRQTEQPELPMDPELEALLTF